MSKADPRYGSLDWRKSRRSAANGECVEVAVSSGRVVIRDSKNPDGMILSSAPDSFRSFLEAIKLGALAAARLAGPLARLAGPLASQPPVPHPALPTMLRDRRPDRPRHGLQRGAHKHGLEYCSATPAHLYAVHLKTRGVL